MGRAGFRGCSGIRTGMRGGQGGVALRGACGQEFVEWLNEWLQSFLTKLI